jgi:Trypsin-like peptidase domain
MRAVVRRLAMGVVWVVAAVWASPALGQFDTAAWRIDVDAVRPLIVMVDSRRPGAGIVVGLGHHGLYVATAAHVVEEEQTVPVALYGDSQPRTARTLQRDDKEDVALLAVDARNAALADIDWERLGNVSAAINGDPRGFALGQRAGTDQRWWISDEPHALHGVRDGRIGFRIQAGGFTLAPGYSGGGLFDTCLQLLGMVQGVRGQGEALEIERVLGLVDGWLAGERYVRLLKPAEPCDRPPAHPGDFIVQSPFGASVQIGLSGRHPIVSGYAGRVTPALQAAARRRDRDFVTESPAPFGSFRPIPRGSELFPRVSRRAGEEDESHLYSLIRGLRLHIDCFSRVKFEKILNDNFRFIPNGDIELRIPLNLVAGVAGTPPAPVDLTVDAHDNVVWLHSDMAPGDRLSQINLPPPRSVVSLLGGRCLLKLHLDTAVQVTGAVEALILDALQTARVHAGLVLTPRLPILPLRDVAVFDRGTAARFAASIDRRLP